MRVSVTIALAVLAAGCGGNAGSTESSLSGSELLRAARDPSPAAQAALERRYQTSIQLCMADAGFRYFIPIASASTTDAGPVTAYGYTDSVRGELAPVAEASVDSDNARYLAALSPAALEAYRSVLDGLDEARPGCRAAAAKEVYGATRLDPSAVAQLERALDQLQADGRVIDLDAAWARCIGASGVPGGVATPSDIYPALDDRRKEIFAATGLAIAEPMHPQPDGATPRSTAVAAGQGAIDSALAELLDVEVSWYEADEACRAQVGYDDAMVEIADQVWRDASGA